MKSTPYTRAIEYIKKIGINSLTKEQGYTRLKICYQCDRYKTRRCKYCCKGQWKIWILQSQCMLDKWPFI
ncbi:hypothetical protein ES703_82424 [subsurface metagenome]